jgi:hypothetical protein
MNHSTEEELRPLGLLGRLHSPSPSKEDLRAAAQLAIQVEMTTIPAYLTGMYSIAEPNSPAYQALRDVVMEEMLHVTQAANLLVAIGGLPVFTGEAAPTYPTYLPHANPKTTPVVGLLRATPEVFEEVYVAIETPAPVGAKPQANHYDTIAQLYDALETGLEQYERAHPHDPLFTPNPQGRQREDIYIGKFGGNPVIVTDLESAKRGIQQVVQQGEGSQSLGQPLNPTNSWATYDHYGQRTDCTYGPIIGEPREMSHFIKFRRVAVAPEKFPPTYPMVSNPRREDFKNPTALALADLFDQAYSLMLDALQLTFRQPRVEGARGNVFFSTALPLMHQTLPILARMLMNTPINRTGNSQTGPNGAPTFLYQPGSSLAQLHTGLAQLMATNDLSREDLLQLQNCADFIGDVMAANQRTEASQSHPS